MNKDETEGNSPQVSVLSLRHLKERFARSRLYLFGRRMCSVRQRVTRSKLYDTNFRLRPRLRALESGGHCLGIVHPLFDRPSPNRCKHDSNNSDGGVCEDNLIDYHQIGRSIDNDDLSD
jgi:hypothetical protein